MIKRIILFAAILIFSFNSQSQTKKYFEGQITYSFSFKSDNIPNPDLSQFFCTGEVLFFKEGNYRHEYLGGPNEFDFYNKDDNKIYFKKRNNDTIYWNDCSTIGDSIQKFLYTEKSDSVMGIPCDRLLIQYKDWKEIHYYNSDLIKINFEWFENYKSNQEYLIDRKEQSIYLKDEHFFDKFIFIETAIKISPEAIEMQKFKLPGI